MGMTMFDLFANYSWEEIARDSSLVVMTAMLFISVFAMGAISEPVRVPAKRI